VAAPGTAIQQYKIYYSYNSGPRILWQSFNAATNGALFPWLQLGLGDGTYILDVTAVNNLGQETDLSNPLSEFGRGGAIVDMADTVRPRAYFGFISGD
jgi:hypothetical protein